MEHHGGGSSNHFAELHWYKPWPRNIIPISKISNIWNPNGISLTENRNTLLFSLFCFIWKKGYGYLLVHDRVCHNPKTRRVLMFFFSILNPNWTQSFSKLDQTWTRNSNPRVPDHHKIATKISIYRDKCVHFCKKMISMIRYARLSLSLGIYGCILASKLKEKYSTLSWKFFLNL